MINQIIKEAMNQNTLGLKEAVETELHNRITLSLEAKVEDSIDLSEETDEIMEQAYANVANHLISEDMDIADLSESQLDELIGTALKMLGRGLKKSLVNKKGNIRFSTAGKADSADAKSKAMEKARKDRERLQKARERIQKEKQLETERKQRQREAEQNRREREQS